MNNYSIFIDVCTLFARPKVCGLTNKVQYTPNFLLADLRFYSKYYK